MGEQEAAAAKRAKPANAPSVIEIECLCCSAKLQGTSIKEHVLGARHAKNARKFGDGCWLCGNRDQVPPIHFDSTAHNDRMRDLAMAGIDEQTVYEINLKIYGPMD